MNQTSDPRASSCLTGCATRRMRGCSEKSSGARASRAQKPWNRQSRASLRARRPRSADLALCFHASPGAPRRMRGCSENRALNIKTRHSHRNRYRDRDRDHNRLAPECRFRYRFRPRPFSYTTGSFPRRMWVSAAAGVWDNACPGLFWSMVKPGIRRRRKRRRAWQILQPRL